MKKKLTGLCPCGNPTFDGHFLCDMCKRKREKEKKKPPVEKTEGSEVIDDLID